MTVIIAEAGENHCGDMGMAHQLIDMSSEAGADYVKFQLYDASKTSIDDPEKEWFHKVQLLDEKWYELANYAKNSGIEPLATPWDAEMAEIIFRGGLDTVKIASFHITDLTLLTYVNEKARRVFMSTGMASIGEIDKAVEALENVDDLFLLHCVSEYPLPYENVNLSVMDTLRERYGQRARIGYSDHTLSIHAAVAAVARGAEVIEEHITLDKNMEGTDHIFSADPEDLPELVRQIRLVETILGTPEKHLTATERENQTFMRNRFRN